MPLGIRDVIKGRAKMGQVTQSFRQDVQDVGILGTVQERVRANVEGVRGRLGTRGTKTAAEQPTPPGEKAGPLDRLVNIFPILGGPRDRLRGIQSGKKQKIGVKEKQEEEFGAVD